MVQEIFQQITTGATSFLTFFKTMLNNVIELFYTTGEGGGLTDIGILMLVGLGTSFALMGIGWVTRLFKLRG